MQDAIDNQQLVGRGKCDHYYGAHLATKIGFAAADLRAVVIKDSGQIMEEQPEQAVTRPTAASRGKIRWAVLCPNPNAVFGFDETHVYLLELTSSVWISVVEVHRARG